MAEKELPDFAALSQNETLAAWDLWGEGDELGLLNLLTPERVAKAGQLIRSGNIFPLNWELELPDPPLFSRPRLEHVINRVRPLINDDVYNNFNPQASSQWDGFGHYGNAHLNSFYGGVKPEQITGGPGSRNGVQAFARRGIAGRAVLLDYRRWAVSQGIEYSPGTDHAILADALAEVARWEGIEFQTGDILLVRMGWIEWYTGLDQAGRDAAVVPPLKITGVAQGEDTLRFLWDNHFAAVAGDTPVFEVNPPVALSMHETLLALWGMTIGEMFYLEALAADCAADGRYDFFFTSAPLNKQGGIASPPNALAIK